MRAKKQTNTTDEAVQRLLSRYSRTKDVQLRDKIVVQFKQLVESVARRFAGSGEPIEDLTQEGYIGLLTATDLYNADKGVKFSTYATHFIIGQIKHALRDKGKIIKEPAWLQELNHRVTRVIDALYQELGRQPSAAEIGKEMHLPEETVRDLLTTREVFKVSSLDADPDEKNGGDLDRACEEKCESFQLPVEDKIVLEMAVNKLKIVEQKVIQEFYYTGLSQTEIAGKLGISCNYVSHILRNGTKKLRRILTTDEIREAQTQLQLAGRRSDSVLANSKSEIVDGLTGAYTIEYLTNRLDEEITRAARHDYETAFAIFSIEGLERVSAQYGSMRRDDAFCDIAQVIKSSVRRCDIVGRVGDQEFGVILLHTKHSADRVCLRVKDAIEQWQFQIENTNASASFAVEVAYAVCPGDSSTGNDLVKLVWRKLGANSACEERKAA